MAKADPVLVRAARQELHRLTVQAGFTGRWPLYLGRQQGDITPRVSFGMATHRPDGILRVEPTVGLLYEPVEVALRRLTNDGIHPSQATLLTNIGYLGDPSTFLSWPIATISEVEATCATIVQTTLARGERFWAEHQTVEELLDAMRPPLVANQSSDLRVPVLLVLAGRVDDGCRRVSERLAEVETRPGPWYDLYREFASRFIAEFCAG